MRRVQAPSRDGVGLPINHLDGRTRDDARVRPKPVIWKPRYATRRMRENAWAKADLQREQSARATPRRRSLFARLLRR